MPELKINSWPWAWPSRPTKAPRRRPRRRAQELQKNGTVAAIFARHGITYQPTL
jgi:hypothetical protein